MMNNKNVVENLNKLYPNPKCMLDYKKDYEEQSDYLTKEKVEMLYPEYINDIEKIVAKVNAMVFKYKSSLSKTD